ncbi:MAG: MFS transporter [Candidatus Baltobacteraceae bacterium]
MNRSEALRGLTSVQLKTFIAAFLGWTLDAFDFFLVVVVLRHVAKDLHSSLVIASIAITATLALRPAGAFIFGWFADRYGRRLPLMIDVGFYSVIELATAFSPNIWIFVALRALYGIAMGGEWGLGAALAMESLPPQKRGLFSGILQEGYAVGNLLAGAVFGILFVHIGWRWMFVIGTLPALLILYIRAHVPESPAWLEGTARRIGRVHQFWPSLRKHWPLFIYTILLMTALNYMSHGTQDPYVTAFLNGQHDFNPGLSGTINAIAAVGAICGGIFFGALSQRFGRRNMMMICALLGLLIVPLWALSHTVALLAAGGFLMQFAVQGAWGIIPAHLNEISPPDIRATFPGFTYQLGNLIAAPTLTIEALLATKKFALPGGAPNYAAAMAVFVAAALAFVVVMVAIGYRVAPERRDELLAGEKTA